MQGKYIKVVDLSDNGQQLTQPFIKSMCFQILFSQTLVINESKNMFGGSGAKSLSVKNYEGKQNFYSYMNLQGASPLVL